MDKSISSPVRRGWGGGIAWPGEEMGGCGGLNLIAIFPSSSQRKDKRQKSV